MRADRPQAQRARDAHNGDFARAKVAPMREGWVRANEREFFRPTPVEQGRTPTGPHHMENFPEQKWPCSRSLISRNLGHTATISAKPQQILSFGEGPVDKHISIRDYFALFPEDEFIG